MRWFWQVKKPDDMNRPDLRTEKVVARLEITAERLEKVAALLADDLEAKDREDRRRGRQASQ
jgi:hypothetical protein